MLGQTVDIDANGTARPATPAAASARSATTSRSTRRAARTFAVHEPQLRRHRRRRLRPGSRRRPTTTSALEATRDIYLTEIDAYLRLVLAHAVNGDIRITVRETTPSDADAGHARRGPLPRSRAAPPASPRATRALPSGNDLDAERSVPKGQVFAETGNVAAAGRRRRHDPPEREILADGSIDICGDFGGRRRGLRHEHDPARPDRRRLRRLAAGARQRRPGRARARRRAHRRRSSRPDLGQQRHRHVPARRPVRSRPRRRPARRPRRAAPATSSSARRRSSAAAPDDGSSAGDAAHDPSIADGEDQFTVWYLQSMNVVTEPAAADRRTRAAAPATSLDLDGQADTDYYAVYTTGSHGSIRNYVINVLDTGAPNDGVDELRDLRPRQPSPPPTTATSPARRRATRPTTSSCCAPSSASTTSRPFGTRTARVPTDLHLADRDRRPPGVRRPAPRQPRPRRRPRPLPRPDRRQRADQHGPADQLRHGAQRPADASSAWAATTRSTSTTRPRS